MNSNTYNHNNILQQNHIPLLIFYFTIENVTTKRIKNVAINRLSSRLRKSLE